MVRVKVKIDGKEKEGILVNTVLKKTRKRRLNDKEYEWVEYYAYVYIPREFVGKKLVLIPLD